MCWYACKFYFFTLLYLQYCYDSAMCVLCHVDILLVNICQLYIYSPIERFESTNNNYVQCLCESFFVTIFADIYVSLSS